MYAAIWLAPLPGGPSLRSLLALVLVAAAVVILFGCGVPRARPAHALQRRHGATGQPSPHTVSTQK